MDKAIIPEKFIDLLRKTDKEHPNPDDVRKLREALLKDPSLVDFAGGLAAQSQKALLNSTKLAAGTRQIIEAGLTKLKDDLSYTAAPRLEQLLIEQILICHLRLTLCECVYHIQLGSEMKLSDANEWERFLGSAQNRLCRSIETLVRVRRLNIDIQINVANDGGQQINIVKKERKNE